MIPDGPALARFEEPFCNAFLGFPVTSPGAVYDESWCYPVVSVLGGLWLTLIGPFASAQAEPEPADPALWRQIEHLTELLRAPYAQ